MEHIHKIGMIVKLYIKLALNLIYAQEISKEIQLENGLIEFKKEFTCERDVQSKMMIM